MRLLQVVAELRPGGAERIVIDLVADAVARDDVVVVASAGGPWVARVEAAGGAHFPLPDIDRGVAGTLAAARRLVPVLRRWWPDLVHTHNVGVTVATRLAMAAARRPPPLVTTLHGLAPSDYGRAARLLARTGGLVVACAPAVGRSLRAAGFPGDRLEVITNGAALAPATPERTAALRSRLGLDERQVVAGVGRLVEQKDWPTLVRALAGRRDLQVVLAGEGPAHDELASLAAALGTPLTLAGAVDDVPALWGLARCGAATSTWEGLPLSLLEALSLGVPMVATAVDGVTDVVPPGAARLVPARDPSAVAAAIDGLLADGAARDRLAASARRAAAGWAPAAMLAAYRALYARVAR